MSRQFYVYLLPEDVEALIHELRSRLDLVLLGATSSHAIPMQLGSPIRNGKLLEHNSVLTDCYIAPDKEAQVKMQYVPSLSNWSIQPESEAIEFRGCEFDGKVLVRGRLYFENDFLANGITFPKSGRFLSWANKLFRIAKKSLRHSNTLDAYVGDRAEAWRQQGGRFAWMVTEQRGPIYEPDEPISPLSP